MDQWIQNLDQDTVVIVPTRSLANNLNEQIAAEKLAQGIAVWEAPTVVLWRDYLHELSQHNRIYWGERASFTPITQQQSLLLFTQVIAATRREEQSLTLLNVQQTAKTVQRSWRLMHDWGISIEKLSNDHVADTQQFIHWVSAYQDLLIKRGFVDDQLLAKQLLQTKLIAPYKKIIWYAYDLMTFQQTSFVDRQLDNGIDIEYQKATQPVEQNKSCYAYSDQQQELLSTLTDAKMLIEQNKNATINIVIPDLQHRQELVRELARDVFYPGLSPLHLQQNNSVYRFSLGEPLKQWPAIETALTLIDALKNRLKVADLRFILRNRFLRQCQTHSVEARVFDHWLNRQRMNVVSVDKLATYYQQCLLEHQQREKPIKQNGFLEFLQSIEQSLTQLHNTLAERKEKDGYAALSFTDWIQHISEWLNLWGWSTSIAGEEMNSVQFQLAQRWQSLLKEFSELTTVQQQTGMSRALEILQQMSHDAVFLPKAPASPILISGLYEAIGRSVDVCFLTGMDDQYPQPAQSDPFIPSRLLHESGYPEASTQDSFQQAVKVIHSLLNPAQTVAISYARHKQSEGEIQYSQSALFRDSDFSLKTNTEKCDISNVTLEQYQDRTGPAWPQGQIVEGGSSIFKNQSNCAFKAFITHQLKFDTDDEVEFGLDSLDRGNIVHLLLERLWERLQTQATLKSLSQDERMTTVEAVVQEVTTNTELSLSDDKKVLLQFEKPRLVSLLMGWLELELKRPTEFSVVEREETDFAVFAGIRFRYSIDRLDMLSDGRTVIIDYKTGNVARKDWLGERIKEPQLPLYALAHDEKKRTPTSGIAFASVKHNESRIISLCEESIFNSGKKAITEENEWFENRADWPDIFTKLAEDFLAGDAQVNPIDEKTCDYCDLQSVCRVSQLRKQGVN